MIDPFRKLFLESWQSTPRSNDIVAEITPVNRLETSQIFQQLFFLLEDLQRGGLHELFTSSQGR